jgi:hypothetical protein
MKNIIISSALIALLVVGMFSLSGCGLLPYYQDPKSITIDDEEYVGGFYDNLYIVGIEYKESSSNLFTRDNHYWWHLDDSTFDMYYCRHIDSLNWFPALYCKKAQYDEIKSYYHNLDNFDYYLGIFLEDEKEVKLAENIDRSIIERAVSLVVDSVNGFTIGYKKTSLKLDGKAYIRPTVYRRSKDGLFTTTHSEWIYYEDNLYVLDYADGSDGTYHLFLLDDDVNAYMVNLLKECGLSGLIII